MRHDSFVSAVAVGLLTLVPAAASGQIRASERGVVSQTVDGTVIAVDYSRPRARGRAPLFGGIVKWGRPWTGANEATVLELSRDVTIEGHDVPAGRWSLWLVPAEEGPWELFLDPRDDLWHTARPGPTDEQIRFPVESVAGEHVEMLTWSFPRVAADGATLTLAWGAKRVPVEIEVRPSYTTTIAAERARPYLGSWEMRLEFGGASGDEPLPFDVTHTDDGELRVRTIFPTPEGELEETEMLLLPTAEGIFQPAILRDGEIFDATAYMYLEFEFEGDRATAFLIRWADGDGVAARGTRKS